MGSWARGPSELSLQPPGGRACSSLPGSMGGVTVHCGAHYHAGSAAAVSRLTVLSAVILPAPDFPDKARSTGSTVAT